MKATAGRGAAPGPIGEKSLMQRRALIVDDEPALSELYREATGTNGMEILALSTSAEAAAHLHKEKFDVVLVGLRMPSLDGIGLTKQVRDSGFNRLTPVIVVSEDQETSAVSEAFKAGANFFLYKPVDKKRLLQLIRATQGSIENERRRFRRVECKLRVRLTSDSAEVIGETVDISLGGILVRSMVTFPERSAVVVAIDLPGEARPVAAAGTVTRVMGTDLMGIELSRVSAKESARLQDFLLPLMTSRGAAVASETRLEPAGVRGEK